MANARWMSMLPVAVVAVTLASCDAPPPAPPPPQPVLRRRAEPQPQAAAAPAPPAEATPAPPTEEPAGPIQTRRTIGETTTTVLDLADAVAKGGRMVDGSEPSGGGILGVTAGAYRSSVATIGGLQVEQKMKLHQAEHGTLPATHKEFVSMILAPGTPDEIRLPMLPYYQDYAFDPESRSLVVVEFAAKKEQRERETTGAAGL